MRKIQNSQKTFALTIVLAMAALTIAPHARASLQPAAEDTLIFTIPLVDDSMSIFHSNWTDNIRGSLAGPVLMSGNTLFFHSQNGYALYNINGKLIEEHSLIKDNAKAAAAGRPKTYLAYPFDS